MKVIICAKFGPPKVLQLREIEKPIPKLKEVLLKILVTTVTIGDKRVRRFVVLLTFLAFCSNSWRPQIRSLYKK